MLVHGSWLVWVTACSEREGLLRYVDIIIQTVFLGETIVLPVLCQPLAALIQMSMNAPQGTMYLQRLTSTVFVFRTQLTCCEG